MLVYHNYELTNLNTLHLTSIAKSYVTFSNRDQLESLRDMVRQHAKFFILGGGSNLILPEYYDGLVIHNQLLGIHIKQQQNNKLITVASGENWDDFVNYCLTNGAYGLENLSLIPGTVGASPVQNIGAYGVEVKNFIKQIEVYDLLTGETKILTNQQCQFSYRNSIFKNKPNWLILSIDLELPVISPMNCSYGDIQAKMSVIDNPTAFDLRNYIINMRNAKLPSPTLLANAGSFFHNPIITDEAAKSLKERHPDLPCYPTESTKLVKISAGWLIDNLELKGFRCGCLGVYHKQALVIVNYTNATQKELLDFAALIIDKVYHHYKITLEIEPIIL